MSFQYAHVETYSRKGSAKGGGSVKWVLAEARRDEGACLHVIAPGEPKQIYGCTLDELETLHDELCASVRYEVAGGKTRAVRQDQHTLFTVVCSYPVPMNEVRGNADEERRLQEWQERNLAWLKAEYDDDLKCVIMHDDEQYPHIHAYVLPDDLRCRNLHAGVSAKEAVMKAGPAEGEDSKVHNKRGDKEYRAAMSRWQDRYFEQVGLPSGLTRLGPGKRRLSREGWKAEQAAVKSVQLAQERVRDLEGQKAAYVARTKSQGEKYIASIKSEAEKLKKEALAKTEESKKLHSAALEKEKAAAALARQAQDSAKKNAQLNERAKKQHAEASKTLKKAQSDANGILSAATERARSVAGIGGFMRSLFDGFRKSKIREQVEKEKADEISALQYAKNLVQNLYDREKEARREADRRASATSSSVRDLRDQLTVAHAQISRLTPKSKGRASVAGNEQTHGRGMRM